MADRNWHTAKSMSTAINPTSDAYRRNMDYIIARKREKERRAALWEAGERDWPACNNCAGDKMCPMCDPDADECETVFVPPKLKPRRDALRPKNVIGDLKHAKRQMEKLRDTGAKR